MKTFEIRKVLVAMDFSPESMNALKTAVAICKRQFAVLTLIHVVEIPLFYTVESGRMLNAMLPGLVKIANENLGALSKKIAIEHSIPVSHIVQSGNAADEVCRWAFDYETDLVVTGTHGTSGLREFFLGSNSYRVVKNAPCPVLTIPGNNTWIDFRKILFPVRLVPHILDKYDIVRPIAKKNGSSMLIAGLVDKREVADANEMSVLVDYIRNQISEDDIICNGKVYYCEDITKQVLTLSNLEKPDLIVITTSLDETIRDFFLGPYSQGIVNRSLFPVLSIRPSFSDQSQQSLSKRIVDNFDSLYQRASA
ncbi:hypothetical protein BH09BAC3_BH09BAC3_32280 [soil metagenome]